MSYYYPDQNDIVTIAAIAKVENEAKIDWAQEEREALAVLRATIQNHVPSAGGRLIDLGCGNGRLLLSFADIVRELVGIEPDKQRFGQALLNVTEAGLAGRTQLLNVTIEDADIAGKADVVLLSHVIQHVDSSKLDAIIAKARRLLKPEGMLYLATNHAAADDFFTKEYVLDGRHYSEASDQKEHSELVNNERGILPIHWFAGQSLYDLLWRNALVIESAQTIHGSGRDIVIIARQT